MTYQGGDLETPWGVMWMVSDGDRLVRIYLPGTPVERVMEAHAANGDLDLGAADDVVLRAKNQMGEYLAGKRTHFNLPLGAEGTVFQKQVWMAMQDIPFGETRSYGELAAAAGSPRAARAVGQANANNPLPIVVPCHRVIAADGSLGGYLGEEAPEDGLKAALLRHEGALVR